MAEILKKPHYDDHDHHQYSNKRSSSFICCFGFSRKVELSEKKSPPQESDNTSNYKIKKIVKFFSWLRFRKKNPAGIKTVPVLDSTVSEKPQKDSKIHWSNARKSKSTTTNQLPPSKRHGTPPPSEIEIVVTAPPDPNPNEKENPNEARYGAVPQSINLENRKISVSGPLHSSKDDTCQKRLSFSRKIEAIRAGSSSQPGSPVNGKPKLVRTIAPRSNRDKTRATPIEPAKPPSRLEPLVGMSVVMVTLVIMVLWGRVCAILCTSAWLYFVPRLSNTAAGSDGLIGNGSGSKNPELESELSKKKVVFEGFLERNHRSS
ncbi:Transmembrane protein [Trema orientale]|uniref:Transmembrane protein n=1 Tax=Trema orientale TaxID=63057 RepID=A0A2P5FM57_TREOI|nr:Transmembrane protein [Trema orientale]